jgi:hypothetical protein
MASDVGGRKPRGFAYDLRCGLGIYGAFGALDRLMLQWEIATI